MEKAHRRRRIPGDDPAPQGVGLGQIESALRGDERAWLTRLKQENFALITAAEYRHLLISGESGIAPDDLGKLSKVKAKLEIVGDYQDMEKVRDVLKELAKG